MTLLDAPVYNEARARKRRNLFIALGVLVVILAGLVYWYWDWPQEHRVNQFFTAVEAKDFPKAFGIWNNDPNWQQHPDQYKVYPYGKFTVDWGASSDYGVIASHKIVMEKATGSGVIVGVDVNGRKTPMFLWVERKSGTIGFSPFELTYGTVQAQ
jgi:hypothetical protein